MKFHVSPVEMINTGIKIKLMSHLMRHDAPMSEREIASILKISHMSVNRTLKELEAYNLVSFAKTGKAHLWKLNRSSYAFKSLAGIIEQMAELDLPLNDMLKTARRVINPKIALKAVLFGSVARGTEEAGSDIDLFVLVKDEKAKKRVLAAAGELSVKCLELYGNKLSAYVLTQREAAESRNTNILAEVEKGVRI